MGSYDKVSVLGVGLLGGSIGMALKRRQLASQVVGIGRRPESLRLARELGAIDAWTTELAAGVADADVVVICTPVEQIAPQVLAVTEYCAPGTLITDVGSTKSRILADLPATLPRGHFVGSHPLAGSEKAGVAAADPELFQDRLVVVTPRGAGVAEEDAAVQAISEFWRLLGGEVRWMTSQDHDAALADVSHLPHLVASMLAAATPPEHLSLAATGWRDSTRIAAGDVELWRQILEENRDHVLMALERFVKVLTRCREALEQHDRSGLIEVLQAGKRNRDAVGN